jgi:hypothetical protein
MTFAEIVAIAHANRRLLARTGALVDRLIPATPTPHGFYDPAGFIAASQNSGCRAELFNQLLPRVRAKMHARGERTLP